MAAKVAARKHPPNNAATPQCALACCGVPRYLCLMISAIKKLGLVYLVFGLGFCVGVAFMGVLVGMYGYKLDAKAMPAAMAATQ